MALNKKLIDEIANVTSKAALSCYKFLGKNDKKKADKAATDSMRSEINKLKKRIKGIGNVKDRLDVLENKTREMPEN